MKQIRKLLYKAVTVITVLSVIIGMQMPAYAAETDTVLNDKEWISYIERSMDTDKTPGLAVAAVKGTDTGFRNWGYANIRDKTPMTEDTPVHIGSCSKAFTALAVLLLQEEGRLSIEDSISQYIPWWHVTYKGQDADIKIWQLLNHCSGIPNAATMAEYPADADAGEEEIARIAEDLELRYPPGETFEYCNLGYCILAYLVETVSGVPFDEYVVREIMQPAGMTHSGYDIPVAQGYIYFRGRPKPYNDPHPKGTEGEGFVVTTASDMALWLKAQLGQTELPEKLKNAIAASHEKIREHCPRDGIISDEPGGSYFNGWYIYDNGVIAHGGWNPTFKAQVIIDPGKDTAVFTDCNSTANTQWYAMDSCYKSLTGRGMYTDIVRCDMLIIDTIASVLSAAALALSLLALIMMLRQKKRLTKRTGSLRKEKALLGVRLAVLIPLLCLSSALPYILGVLMGYPGFGYQKVWIWGGQSAVIMGLMLDILFLILIAAAVRRYTIRKHTG